MTLEKHQMYIAVNAGYGITKRLKILVLGESSSDEAVKLAELIKSEASLGFRSKLRDLL
jgi:hypothetical protein